MLSLMIIREVVRRKDVEVEERVRSPMIERMTAGNYQQMETLRSIQSRRDQASKIDNDNRKMRADASQTSALSVSNGARHSTNEPFKDLLSFSSSSAVEMVGGATLLYIS